MARVSIIIPTHNRAAMLRRAIESGQAAGGDVEIIVVDDASTDETGAMCRSWPGIVYLRMDRNVRQAQARNAGILKSSGEYLTFLDDDDLRLPGSLDKQADMLAGNAELGFVYGQVHIGDPETCVPTGVVRPAQCKTGDLFWDLMEGNFIYLPSVLVRKRHLISVGLFDRTVLGTEDWDAWLRLCESHAVDAVQEPVAIYRDFSRVSGQTSSNRPNMSKSTARTLAKALRSPRARAADPATREKVRSELTRFLWETLIQEGHNALAERRYNYAARNFLTAARLDPARAARVGAIANFIGDSLRSLRTK